MRAIHYVAIAAAVALIALLYWGGNTVPPAKKEKVSAPKPAVGGMPMGEAQIASTDSIITASMQLLDKNVSDTVAMIEKEMAGLSDSAQMIEPLQRLSKVLERSRQYPATVYYRALAAKLENSEKSLTFAAQLFLELLDHEGDRSMQLWEAAEAIKCTELSLKLDSNSQDAKLAMASAYIQGTAQPMIGVQMLLGMVRESPKDIPANMMLGRMSIRSGQFEKAIKRFETVLEQEAENKEALYFLAQAYEGTGNNKKAIELLEECKRIVNNPDFSRDIDQHINSLK